MRQDSELINLDPWLKPYESEIQNRIQSFKLIKKALINDKPLKEAINDLEFFGLNKTNEGDWVLREWAPNATKIYFICDANNWQDSPEYQLRRTDNDIWEIKIPKDKIQHLSKYKLHIYWNDGGGFRIPAWSNYAIQDEITKDYCAQIWDPPKPFQWHDQTHNSKIKTPLIYEAHIGMSGEQEKVASYIDFTKEVLPYIKKSGYNIVQLMGIQEHPYYGSFGYHVSNFFAPSSRFGTPDDLKNLINTAHELGLSVIIDLVHSHAVKNELEGLSKFDGTYYQYFHDGQRGNHPAWDSRCFNYGKPEVIKFLLNNCRYWLDEFHIDGFRFDGVTSMLYTHHGLGINFSNYDQYFKDLDLEAIRYLSLANQLIHEVNPNAITIAEEMSGMPGVVSNPLVGGLGFDYRLSMGVPDMWIRLIKEQTDEQWNMSTIFHELSQHRPEEKTINYAESHDQALVGDKTIIFRLIDKEMYNHMSIGDDNLIVDRGLALHKMIRLLTASTNSGGYMNFMGNEFGHPEWIDFPREGNNWSYKYARRQWSLAKNKKLKYQWLAKFDIEMLKIIKNIRSNISYVQINDDDHILSFYRDDYLFVFNFHPDKSFTDYGLSAPSGKYQLTLSSDSIDFGGQDRINPNAPYQTTSNHSGDMLQVYIPARTAIVFKKN